MDTNQFTQQLVEFAQVEQQLKSNTSLSTLVTLQQSAQATQALALVGATVVVNGSTVAACQRPGELDAERHQAGGGDHHHHRFASGQTAYTRQVHRQFRRPDLHLGRPRQ